MPSEECQLKPESNTKTSDTSTKQVVISSKDLIEAFNRGNGDSHAGSVRNEGMISCPLCGRGIIVEDESEETKNSVMNKHIDRCSRVVQSKVNSKERESTMRIMQRRAVPYNEDSSAIDIEDSDSEEYKPKAKNETRKRLKKLSLEEKASQSRGSKPKQYIFSDEISEEEDEEEEEEEYKPRKKARPRKAQGDAAIVKDNVGQSNTIEIHATAANNSKEEDEDADVDQNELMRNTTVAIVSDDWETEDYQNRISELDTTEYVDTQFGGRFYALSWEKLFEYQKEGCRWLFDLYQEGVGGILGDEMGDHSIRTLSFLLLLLLHIIFCSTNQYV